MRSMVDLVAVLSSVSAVALAGVGAFQLRTARRLRWLADTEPLTGLANRREFSHAVAFEIARSSRSGRPFVVALLDVDRLKFINDCCGRRAGDRAIRRVANALRSSCRVTDTAARIGGDEFAVSFPETNATQAIEFVSRVRAVLAGHQRGGTVTVSCGIARHPRDGATVDALLRAADCALYVEKCRRARPEPPSFLRLVRARTRDSVRWPASASSYRSPAK